MSGTSATGPGMPDLPRYHLGSSDLEISPVGIGTAPMGSTSAWSISWGRQDEGDAIRAIHAAIDEGVNWIDTAPFYGWGRAEAIVGKAIRARPDAAYIFTKCGTMNDGSGGDFMDLSPGAIRRDLEASLGRLGLEHVDLLQLHDPDPAVPIEESWVEVHRLIEEGKVRHGGLSNHGVDLIERALAIGPVVSAQHQYNLLARQVESEILPFCRAHGIGVLSWGSLAEGLLTEEFDLDRLESADFRRSRPNFQNPRYSRIRALVAELAVIASGHGHNASDLAIAWLLARGVSGAIVGVRTDQEAVALPAAGRWTPPHEALQAVDAALSRFSTR
jgi:aryl-alcohol dehydrogenase-like predicted oxidoreductase